MILLTSDSTLSTTTEVPPPYITNFGAKECLLAKSLSVTDSVWKNTANSREVSTLDGTRRLCIRWDDDDSRDTHELSRGYLVDTADVEEGTTSPQLGGLPSTSNRDDDGGATESDNHTDIRRVPLVYLDSDDPTVLEAQPCCIVAYAYRPKYPSPGSVDSLSEVVVTLATLVRIMPPMVGYRPSEEGEKVELTSSSSTQLSTLSATWVEPTWLRRVLFLHDLLAETGHDRLSTRLEGEVVQNHNTETIDELTLKLSVILSKTVYVGTTRDAFQAFQKQKRQLMRIEDAIRIHHNTNNESRTSASQSRHDAEHPGQDRNKDYKTAGLQWWPAIIVHSPNHSDGKTLLVQAIANRLGCAAIHLIRPGTLLAKYGSQADAALESRLHSMVVTAACRNPTNPSICIILDQLDTMMPPQLSGRSGAGDAAVPILNSIASYLRKITSSLQRDCEFPFPIKNALYNGTSLSPSLAGAGQVLPVTLCLVGIVTCPDDGWRSTHRSNGVGPNDGGGSSILDCMIADRYRMPLRTAKTRLTAFRAAFEMEELTMDSSCAARLGPTAASATWARGGAFNRVAKRLKQILNDSSRIGTKSATIKDLELALALVKSGNVEYESVKVQARGDKSSDGDQLQSGSSYFESVGGNLQAKAALEDALALDPIKREMLSRFSLSPPSGVLLYGPPGCGKTLLAKAVAKLLTLPTTGIDNPSDSFGGTFISIRISDIVSAELGTSEKIIVSTFEFADKSAPSVIFLDEFQSLFIDRSRGGTGKLTTTLLQCLDMNRNWSTRDKAVSDAPDSAIVNGNHITVIGATNTPWMVDSAFLRPGRFDRVVHVGLPSSAERGSILRLHISRMRVRDSDNPHTLSTLCESIAKQTHGFSGADLAALCRAAAVRALIEKGDGSFVDQRDFDRALRCDVKPSSDDKLVQRLLTWRP